MDARLLTLSVCSRCCWWDTFTASNQNGAWCRSAADIAYRWFCGFELADKLPDHSTFSKTRLRKWNESQLFQQVFLEIIRRCVKNGLIDGKELAADGTYLPANVSKDSWIDTEIETELSMQSYLDRLR